MTVSAFDVMHAAWMMIPHKLKEEHEELLYHLSAAMIDAFPILEPIPPSDGYGGADDQCLKWMIKQQMSAIEFLAHWDLKKATLDRESLLRTLFHVFVTLCW